MILPEPDTLLATIIMFTTQVRTNASTTQWSLLPNDKPPGEEEERAAASVEVHINISKGPMLNWLAQDTVCPVHQQSATEEHPRSLSVCGVFVFAQ